MEPVVTEKSKVQVTPGRGVVTVTDSTSAPVSSAAAATCGSQAAKPDRGKDHASVESRERQGPASE